MSAELDASVWLSPQAWMAVRLSLKVAFWAIVFALPVAFLAAYALARWSFWGKSLFNALTHLPLILPPVVTGYALLLLFGARGPLGELLSTIGIEFAFRWTGAAMAAGVMAFPLMVRAMRLSLEAVDQRLEQASASLGASPFNVFMTVTLPLSLPGILVGAVLGFAKALGEFGATITFVANIPGETQTLSTAIYSFLQVPGGESDALKLVALSIAISMAALLGSEWLARRAQARLGGA